MPQSEFERDDGWQRGVRESVLIPRFHDRWWRGRWRDADDAEQRRGIDCFLLGAKANKDVSIEEKIVRYRERPYTAFALETWSCSVEGRTTPGWMQYSEADFLLYCFSRNDEATVLEAFLLRMPELKKWFWSCAESFPTTVTNQANRTVCRVVPVKDACEAALLRRYEFSTELSRTAI